MPASTEVLLDAQELERRLSDRAQVSGISIRLERGDVLGLLGLNGAGKSTTLRMLAGVLTSDAGSITVCGHSMVDEPLAARARIGFLPDEPPLYGDMRVIDYLQLVAQLRRLKGNAITTRINAVLEQCSLEEKARALINTLSKGYRQRVGLAQALIHEPDVLLLDEPSNGLDPQQMDSMRTVIRETGRKHAVVFSTHLLSEAQAVCNRVAIMHDGKLIADRAADGDDLEALFRGATE